MVKRILVVALPAVAALVGVLALVMRSPSSEPDRRDEVVRSRRIQDKTPAQRRKVRSLSREERIAAAKAKADKPKPVIEVSDEESEKLDELEKKVLNELKEALDSEDFKSLQRALSHLRALGVKRALQANAKESEWTRFVSRSLRSAAISALGWFEGEGLPELAEFLADPDPDIMQEAMDQFELSMGDFTLGDYAKAEIIKSVCSVITDEDMVDWMMMEAINARNSVGISTLAYIAQNGTDMAKGKVPEYLEFFTGEEITTIEQAEQWYAANPDDPSVDDDLYGSISE